MKSWIKKLFGIKEAISSRKDWQEKTEEYVKGFDFLVDVIGKKEHSKNSNITSVRSSSYFYGIVANIPTTRILKEKNLYVSEVLIPLDSEFLKNKYISAVPKVIKFPLDTVWVGSFEAAKQLENTIRQ